LLFSGRLCGPLPRRRHHNIKGCYSPPGFADPFPAAATVTLDNPAYRWLGLSLMRGKLDWALLRRLRVRSRALGNEQYALSDHKWMALEVSFD
jgi:hypothetical protein